MTNKDRFFSFIETIVQAIKFRGLWFGMVFVYHAVRIRFLLKNEASSYAFLGFTIYFDSKWSVVNAWLELFGQNVYLFTTNSQRPLIVDGGANIGDSVIYFKWLYPNATILAYEPNPHAYSLLTKNIKENHFIDIHTVEAALGLKDDLIQLMDDKSGTYNAGTTTQNIVTTADSKIKSDIITVKQLRLSDNKLLRDSDKIDLLKLDIEGAESKVLEDLKDLLFKVENVILEYHLVDDTKDNSCDTIISLLQEAGLKVGIQGVYRDIYNLPSERVSFIYGHRN